MAAALFTEILPPGEGRRWGCGEDPVAGGRLIAVVMLFVRVLIQFIVLLGDPNSCLVASNNTNRHVSHSY